MLRKLLIAFVVGLTFLGVQPPTPASSQTLQATDCPEITDSITRLYSAYFLRAPDQAGFDFWVSQSMAGGHNLDSMSDFFSISTEFQTRYGTLTNDQFVDLIYRNILGRPGEPAGRAFWLGELNSGNRTRGNVMINFSESSEYVARSQTFTPLAGNLNWYPAGTTYECGDGPGEVSIDPNRFYDIAISNPTNSPQDFSVDSIINGRTQNEISGTVPALNTRAFFNSDPVSNFGNFPLRITVPVGVKWMVVSSATPLPEDRSGW